MLWLLIFPFIVEEFSSRKWRRRSRASEQTCRVIFLLYPLERDLQEGEQDENFQFNFQSNYHEVAKTHLKALSSDGLSCVSSMSWTSPNSRARFSAFAVRMGMRLMGVWGFDGELDLKLNYFRLVSDFWGFFKIKSVWVRLRSRRKKRMKKQLQNLDHYLTT